MKRMKNKTRAVLKNCPDVRIEAGEALFPYFQPVFQGGFLFRCRVGESIEDLLFRQLLLKKSFVEEKISTVFLDGQCVDDISRTILNDGSVVAFSSALPGLVGATLRRGGFYACLRNSINYRQKDMSVDARQGTITIKLFNLLMEELGPVFLKKGIIMACSTIVGFLQQQREAFWKEVHAAYLGDNIIAPSDLSAKSTYGNGDYITIRIDDRDKFQ
jgi:hypothetical protein